MTSPLLNAHDLHLAYAEQTVLSHCSFTLEAGQRMALLGRSGSGKTSLLHACAGLLPVTSGELRVAGFDLHLLNDAQRTVFRRRHVGVIFQQFNLIPTLTVLENLQLILAMNQFDTDSPYPLELLEQLGLGDKAKRFPDQLSGGEQQRVAVARALVHRPSLLLADEPTGNLDLETARQVMALLISVCRSAKAALVLVTHSTELPDGLDQIARLHQGRLSYD